MLADTRLLHHLLPLPIAQNRQRHPVARSLERHIGQQVAEVLDRLTIDFDHRVAPHRHVEPYKLLRACDPLRARSAAGPPSVTSPM
jgi:hypothetical protein